MDLITRLADTLCFPKPVNNPVNNSTTYQYGNRSAVEGGIRTYALSDWGPGPLAWLPFAHSYLTIHAGDILTTISDNYIPGYALVINHRTNQTGLVPQNAVCAIVTVNPDGNPMTATADHTMYEHLKRRLPGWPLEMQTGDTIRVVLGDDVGIVWGWGKNERTGKFGFFPAEKVDGKFNFIYPAEDGRRPKHD